MFLARLLRHTIANRERKQVVSSRRPRSGNETTARTQAVLVPLRVRSGNETKAMAEEEVMRKRLIVEGDGGGDDRRVMSLLKTFVRWCNNAQLSEEESEATFQKMLFTLGQCEFSFNKIEMVMEMNRREMQRYERVYSEIEDRIEEAKEQIVELREELQKSRVIRKHRQEYDALAKVILQHAPRQLSQKRITELEEKLKTLKENRDSLNQKLERRRKQFHLLVHSIRLLQDLLDGEEEEEESATMDTS